MKDKPIFEYSNICNSCDKGYRLKPNDKFKVCDHYDFSNCEESFYWHYEDNKNED